MGHESGFGRWRLRFGRSTGAGLTSTRAAFITSCRSGATGGSRAGGSTPRALATCSTSTSRNRRCVAEPGITFAALVEQTLPHGLVPAVVPELKGITIGGAVAGCSVESMSYRYGGFHDTCESYELIDGTGEVRNLSRAEDPFLFEMVHGSYGTLGVLARITFKLVPAKPYVHMTYVRHESPESFFEDLMRHCESGEHDFIDGIVHAPNDLVLCLGDFEESRALHERLHP